MNRYMTFRSLFKTGKQKSRSTEVSDRHLAKVITASGLGDDESEAVASSPDLYAKVRTRIAAARIEPESGGYWLETLLLFKRTALVTAVMVLVIGAAALYFKMKQPVSPPGGTSQLALTGVPERADGITACSISARDECAISRSEVLATIVPHSEEEFER